MRKNYIGERPPLICRIKGTPYYTLRCPAECYRLVKECSPLSKIIFNKGDKEHI